MVGKFRFTVVEREFLGGQFGVLVGKIWVLAILLESTGGQNLPAFHVEVILRAAERILFAGFSNGAAEGRGGPQRAGSAHRIGVETLVRSGVAGTLAAVTQRKNDSIIGLAKHDSRLRNGLPFRT